jgi:hypothetical protein
MLSTSLHLGTSSPHVFSGDLLIFLKSYEENHFSLPGCLQTFCLERPLSSTLFVEEREGGEEESFNYSPFIFISKRIHFMKDIMENHLRELRKNGKEIKKKILLSPPSPPQRAWRRGGALITHILKF